MISLYLLFCPQGGKIYGDQFVFGSKVAEYGVQFVFCPQGGRIW